MSEFVKQGIREYFEIECSKAASNNWKPLNQDKLDSLFLGHHFHNGIREFGKPAFKYREAAERAVIDILNNDPEMEGCELRLVHVKEQRVLTVVRTEEVKTPLFIMRRA